jgi:DNA-binding IclR family transcriptional regulator
MGELFVVRNNIGGARALQPRSSARRGESAEREPAAQSLSRALDLLEAFLDQGSELSLTQLSAAAKLNRTTAHRLLKTLEARGYLQRGADNRKYRLGVRVFELGARFHNQIDIRRAALPEMTSLVEQTGQAAFLCVRDGDHALCLERVGGRHRVRIFTWQLGERQLLHWGAAPRALLSGFSDAEILTYAARTGLPTLTPQTIAAPDQLLADARRTRAQGYALSNEDVTAGIAAVGVPVRDHTGEVVASISVSGLAATYTAERIAELADATRSAGYRLSRQLGYGG